MAKATFQIYDSEIGDIQIIRKRNIKNFNIRLKPFDIVTITSPYSATEAQIRNVITRKKNWILDKQQINKEIEQSQTLYHHNAVIKTFYNTLRIQKQNIESIELKGESPEYTLAIPHNFDTSTTAFQQGIRNIISFILKDEAAQFLPVRVAELANRYNFRYKSLTIRNNKTRWGSCSTKGSINLNIQLMRLPARLIDYIILHELCHTRHPNHGPGFKNLLNSIMPHASIFEEELKKYRTQIY